MLQDKMPTDIFNAFSPTNTGFQIRRNKKKLRVVYGADAHWRKFNAERHIGR